MRVVRRIGSLDPWLSEPSMRRGGDRVERRLIQLLSGTSERREESAAEILTLVHDVDTRTLISLLKRINMLTLLAGRLLALGAGDMPDLDRELQSHAARAHDWGMITEFTALDLLDRLTAAGIRAMPLKGSILARQLYGNVAARASRDIDILVAPDDLAGAVAAVQEFGWRWQPDVSSSGGMPLLHETLVHPALPRVELHWRVHWYEGRFAADALARAVKLTPDGPLQMQAVDGLIALMLFYARDGFAGLRFAADAAAWWDLKCAGSADPSPREVVDEFYPALVAPVAVASGLLDQLVGIPSAPPCGMPLRWRVAAGLASPFVEGGRLQAEANAGLIDLLLAPPGATGDASRRVMRNAPVDMSQPGRTLSPWRAVVGHVLRVTRRWALAAIPAMVRGYTLSREGSTAAPPVARPMRRRPRRSS